MEKGEIKKEAYRSITEFEKKFFPNSFKKQSAEKATDYRLIGINMANESLDRLRRKLVR